MDGWLQCCKYMRMIYILMVEFHFFSFLTFGSFGLFLYFVSSPPISHHPTVFSFFFPDLPPTRGILPVLIPLSLNFAHEFYFLFVKLRCSMQRIHRFAALLLTLSAKFLNYQQSSGLITRHAYKNHSHFICTQIMSYWYWEF